jgi:putative copper export protein
MLFKLAVFLGMTGIVALIGYSYLPRLEHLVTQGAEDAGMLLGKMVAFVKINLCLGVLVLLLSGFLAFNG